MDDVQRTLGILLAGQNSMQRDIATLTKYIVGNGQPGLLFTVKELKTEVQSLATETDKQFVAIDCWQQNHDAAEREAVDVLAKNNAIKETRTWDIKKAIIVAGITFVSGTVMSALFNYFIMERMVKAVYAVATATPMP